MMIEHMSLLPYSILYIGIFIISEGQSTSLTISPTSVDENSPQTLTCKYIGDKIINSVVWYANDITEGYLNVNVGCSKVFWRHENVHSYSCDVSSKTFRLTILSVNRSNITDIWRCEIGLDGVQKQEKSNNVTPSVKILITYVNMTLPQPDTVTLITLQEKSSQQFTCVTSGGLPEPIIKWYNDSKTPGDKNDDKEITSTITTSYSNTGDGLIATTSTLTFTASNYDNQINIYCSAYVSTDQTPLYSTRKPKLNVLHGPVGPPTIQGFASGVTYRVIENTPGQLTCTIKGGNPLPTLSWTCFNTGTPDNTDADTVSKTARWTAVRGQDRKCTCYSSHSSGSSSVEIQVEILYPPTTPEFYIINRKVSGTVKVIRNNKVSITCRSSGKPDRIEYTWKHDKETTSGAVLTTSSIKNDDQYTCEVENSMNTSNGNVVPGKNTSSLSFELLYPPEVGNLYNRGIAEGQTFSYDCPVTVGNPKETSFKWSKNDATISKVQRFTIQNVSRTDSAFYNCTVENTMKQTGEQTATKGSDSKGFYLNVWYGAKVEEFYVKGFFGQQSVTVNESITNIQFHCNVDSNPGSSISIQNERKQLQSDTNIKTLSYMLPSASCLDTGVYTCMGYNTYNSEKSLKQLQLFVNCSPRKSPLSLLKTNVTSQQNKAAVFTFTALAHPVPSNDDFRWFRHAHDQWLHLLNNPGFRIDTNHLTSNLTILSVNKTLFGTYRLVVKNLIGEFEQIFNLLPEDRPQEPTHFNYRHELVNETSFTVEWKPGLDNGPKQTFVLKYRKQSKQKWTVVEIPDSGEVFMNYTVHDLSSGTNYTVVLYASNRLGNSKETAALTISTKAICDKNNYRNDKSATIIVGVVLGLIIVMISVYATYVAVLNRRMKGATEGQALPGQLKGNPSNMQTYVNLSYSPNTSNQQQQQQNTEQSESTEYTSLDKRLRIENSAYDNLDNIH